MRHWRTVGFAVLVLLLVTGVAAAEGQWMVAANTLSSGEGRPAGQPTEDSVLVWNASPVAGETVEWFGGREYSQEAGGFAAHGYGRAVWRRHGGLMLSDEGNYFMGRRHGRIVQTLANGGTIVADWEDGVLTKQTEPDKMANLYRYDYDKAERYPLGYNGNLTPLRLLTGLSALLGEPIVANSVTVTDSRIVVDLSAASAPIAPPTNKKTYADRLVYEESILNSIARTIGESFGRDKPLYFSVDGGSYQGRSGVLSAGDPFVNIELKQAHRGMPQD